MLPPKLSTLVNDMRLRRHQTGTALVENAMTMAVFLMMVMAIIEFSILMYVWTRGAEAARYASRYAIVSDPVMNLSTLDCDGGTVTEITTTCDGVAACNDLMERINAFMPQAEPENIEVTYRCSDAGFAGRPVELMIPEVSVKVINMVYRMVIPGLIGMPGEWPLPPMTSTRTGEDLETVSSS